MIIAWLRGRAQRFLRKRDINVRPGLGGTRYGNAAAVQGNNAFCDREAEADAFTRRRSRFFDHIKAIENVRLRSVGNPFSRVRNHNQDAVAA